jgi:hypothetical protein
MALIVVRQWVVDKLIFIGREECAVALEAYWDNGGLDSSFGVCAVSQTAGRGLMNRKGRALNIFLIISNATA